MATARSALTTPIGIVRRVRDTGRPGTRIIAGAPEAPAVRDRVHPRWVRPGWVRRRRVLQVGAVFESFGRIGRGPRPSLRVDGSSRRVRVLRAALHAAEAG